jgi:cytochrome c-type biogenesis protein CcmH
MGLILAGGLLVAMRPDDSARTPEDRIFAIARTTKCPTCRSQSVAESEAPIAKEIRADIARRVESGDSDDDIRGFLRSRFGEEVELRPSASGVTGLVWVIPVVATVLGALGLTLIFLRWRRTDAVEATDEDRELVARAQADS